MIHQTIAKLGQGIHFRGQIEHWSILTGALVAKHYIMGHLSTLLLRFLQNQKMHVIYIILSHAKNQPPTTILSYV